MHLEYQLKPRDYTDSAQLSLRSSRILYIVLWILALWLLTRGGMAIADRQYVYGLYEIVLGLLIAPELRLIDRYLWYRRWNNTPDLQQTLSLESSTDGFIHTAKDLTLILSWSHYVCLKENARLFLLYRSSSRMLPIPKRSFANEQQMQEFRDCAQQGIKNSTRIHAADWTPPHSAIKLEYRLSRQDLQEACKGRIQAIQKFYTFLRLLSIVCMTLGVISCLGWLFLLFQALTSPLPVGLSVSEFWTLLMMYTVQAPLCLCLGILFNPKNDWLYRFMGYWQSKQDRRLLHQPTEAIVNDSGLWIQTAMLRSQSTWNYYTKCANTSNLFLLLKGTAVAEILPKRAFADPQAISDFQDLVQQKLGQ